MNKMEHKIKNLYQVWMRGRPNRLYTAANSQQEAVDIISKMYDDEDKTTFNVEFVAVVYL